MIAITRAAEYSLRATAALVQFRDSDRTATVAEIAVSEAIPESFLRKLLKPLIRADIVRSERGYSGGITLAKPPSQISVLDVIEAVDGKLALNDCVLNPTECGLIARCAIHGLWVDTTEMLQEHLRNYTLEDIQREYMIGDSTESPAEE